MIWEVFLNGKNYTKNTFDLKLERKRNHFYRAIGKIVGFSESEFLSLKKSDEITIRSTGSPKNSFQGEFSKLDYESNRQTLTFTSYNFPAKFNNWVWTAAGKEWTNTTVDTILDDIFTKYTFDTFWYEISDDDLKNLIINFRIENEAIWSAVMRLLRQVGATWYAHPDSFSTSEKKFTQEKIYFAYDFYKDSKNLIPISKKITKKYDNIINYVKVLGRGDGINQLQSINFHATISRSTLSALLSDQATTITLIDASKFHNGDNDIWIGIEKIHYTLKVGNVLTVSERGKDGTPIYEHRKGVEVYSAEFSKDSPENESSIKKHGICSTVYTDKTIIDQGTLDFLAQRIIAEYAFTANIIDVKTKYVDDLNIRIDDKMVIRECQSKSCPTSPYSSKLALLNHYDSNNNGSIEHSEMTQARYDWYDDLIPVEDMYVVYSCWDAGESIETYCTTEYKVTEFLYSDRDLAIRVKGGGSYDPLIGKIADISKKIEIENTYGAGATNIYQIGPIIESLSKIDSNDKYFEFSVFIPEEAVAINKVRLTVKAKPWRSYEKVVSSHEAFLSEHTTQSSSTTVEKQLSIENVSGIPYGDWGRNQSIHIRKIHPVTNLYTAANFYGVVINALMTNMHLTESSTLEKVEILCDVCGKLLFKYNPSSSITLAAAYSWGAVFWSESSSGSSGDWTWCSHSIAKAHMTHTWKIRITYSAPAPCCFETSNREIITKHDHIVPGSSHSHIIPEHGHTLTHGIYEGESNNLYLKIKKPSGGFVIPPGWDNFSSKTEDLAKYFARGENKLRIGLTEAGLGRLQLDGFVMMYLRSVQ